MLDDVATRKHIDWDGRRFLGYTDIGNGVEDDSLPVAMEAVVVMAVAVDGSWKIPIENFFISSLTGAERPNLIRQALIQLHDAGVDVVSLTCFYQQFELHSGQVTTLQFASFSHPINSSVS